MSFSPSLQSSEHFPLTQPRSWTLRAEYDLLQPWSCVPHCAPISVWLGTCVTALHLCYIRQVRGYNRIISQDVITSSLKQNKRSSKLFDNTVLTIAMILITVWATKVAAQLFSLSNFVFKNILFSSLNLILSDEKWSNECSHFCWRQLGSETQERRELYSKRYSPNSN